MSEAMVDRLAQYIFQQESNKCSTLDEAIHHQSKWRRGIPEARAMLNAAIQPPQPPTKESVRGVSDADVDASMDAFLESGDYDFGFSGYFGKEAMRATLQQFANRGDVDE